MKIKLKFKNLLLVFFSSIIAILGGELYLRSASPHDFYASIKPNLHITRELWESEIFPGLDDTITVTSNEWGYRSVNYFEKESYGILAVGGSTTYCIGLSDKNTWPYLLGEKLKELSNHRQIIIGNVGKPGLNTAHHYLQINDISPQLDGLKTILLLVGVNDFLRAMKLGKAYSAPESEPNIYRRAFVNYPRKINPKWYQRTEWWMHARDLKSNYLRYRNGLNGHDNLLTIMNNYFEIPLLADLPDLSSALADYEHSLKRIAGLCRERKVEVVFISQPTLWSPELDAKSARYAALGAPVVDGHSFSFTALEEGMKRFNQVLAQTASEEGVKYIDLAERLPKDTTVFYDHCHFNNTGSRQVADILIEQIGPFIVAEQDSLQ